jgi:predicted DNA-binding transcriptional regulator AlpA
MPDRHLQFPTNDEPLVAPMGDRIVSSREARIITGLSATTMWRERRHKRFPEPVQLSPHRKGYVASELYAWLQARIDAARQKSCSTSTFSSSTSGRSSSVSKR